jgi:nucleoside-diphosphate-sugar epimerase
VTGGTGFIGRHLVRRMAMAGHEVTLLQRSTEQVAGAAELLPVAELTPGAVHAALRDRQFEWVFHLAGYGVRPEDRDIESMFRINVELSRAIVDALGRGSVPPRAVVLAGSGSEYRLEGVNEPVAEDHPLETEKLYGASKAAGGLCALATGAALGVPVAVARFFGVFGPGEPKHRLLPSLVSNLLAGRRVSLSAGLQRRDSLYVDDAVEALVALANALEAAPGRVVVNVASGKPETVRAFSETCAKVLEAPLDLLGFGDLSMRPDEVMCFSGDPSRLQQLTGWRPRHDLTSGIERTIGHLS